MDRDKETKKESKEDSLYILNAVFALYISLNEEISEDSLTDR